ncbi:MAG: hypothetical protein RRY16_02475 [Bacilli bacterium]
MILSWEKVYSIDKLIIAGYSNQLSGDLVNIQMQNEQQFNGNIVSQGELINKIERELSANFIANNDTDYVLQNYQKVSSYLTTPELRQNFISTINELVSFENSQNVLPTPTGPRR